MVVLDRHTTILFIYITIIHYMGFFYGDPDLLDTSTDYTWFISYVEIKPVKRYSVLFIDWSCREKDMIVKEYLRVVDKLSGTRLYNMMRDMGWTKTPEDTNLEDVKTFFERGTRIKSKVIRYWGELNSESMSWKLNYETVRPYIDKTTDLMTVDEKKKLVEYAQRYASYEEALSKIASNSPHKVEAYIQLYKDGEIVFKSG